MAIEYAWRGSFENHEVNRLHAEGFGHGILNDDWVGQVERHSLGWVCARRNGEPVGFVNVAWDGSIHAFILDTLVTASARGEGIGTEMVGLCAREARVAGCERLHVDFDEHLSPFYLEACGSTSTSAGLIDL
ncbi:MAG TPA: GNAT family N-acetyltransferase [Actinomycetota bacterium]